MEEKENKPTSDYIDVDITFIKLAKRMNEVSGEEAIDILNQLFIDNCGISYSTRAVVWNVSEFWLSKWIHENPDVPNDADFYTAMSLRSEDYAKFKNSIDKYKNDVYFLPLKDLYRIANDMLKETDDIKEQIVIATGVMIALMQNSEDE